MKWLSVPPKIRQDSTSGSSTKNVRATTDGSRQTAREKGRVLTEWAPDRHDRRPIGRSPHSVRLARNTNRIQHLQERGKRARRGCVNGARELRPPCLRMETVVLTAVRAPPAAAPVWRAGCPRKLQVIIIFLCLSPMRNFPGSRLGEKCKKDQENVCYSLPQRIRKTENKIFCLNFALPRFPKSGAAIF